MRITLLTATVLFTIALVIVQLFAQSTPNPSRTSRPGVKEVQVPFSTLKPTAIFRVGGHADWIALSDSDVWVATSEPNTVQEIDPSANKLIANIPMPGEPCSGIALGFGSLWVPFCAEKPALARVDIETKKISTILPIGPAGAESGISVSPDSVWLVTDKKGTLARIDPDRNQVREEIQVPAGSYNPRYSDGIVWITNVEGNSITAVDSQTGQILASIDVGANPRFLAVGDGSVWTLNQGDGSITRVDTSTRKIAATIDAGISGKGGDICFAHNTLWTTIFTIPLGRIDPKTNRVIRQWTGSGGDSLGCGTESLWLTDYDRGLLQRFSYDSLIAPTKTK